MLKWKIDTWSSSFRISEVRELSGILLDDYKTMNKKNKVLD
jgi:hypothetical protein